MEDVHVLLFYKYVVIENPVDFIEKHLQFCKDLGLLGRILIAKEGINGSVSGNEEQVDFYKKEMRKTRGFEDILFKEDIVKTHPFTKMKVLLRNEIVRMGIDVDMSKKGGYVDADGLLELYDEKGNLKENIILLDARNDYEFKVGRFKDAIHLNIKTFREFPLALKTLKEKEEWKNKKIVTYCTGGIRCEKASAYLKEQGFEDVYQLKEGIITFGKEHPDSVWQGKLFVFDKRLLSSINSEEKDLKCEICGKECDLYRNCRNVYCDELFISCLDCEKNLNGCCSDECFVKFKEQCMEKSMRKQNRRAVNVIEVEGD